MTVLSQVVSVVAGELRNSAERFGAALVGCAPMERIRLQKGSHTGNSPLN